MMNPDARGNQPPSPSLVKLASRNARSMMNNNDSAARSQRLFSPVRDLMRLKVSGVTMVIAPETARP